MAETSGPWAGDTFSEGQWRELYGLGNLPDGTILPEGAPVSHGLTVTYSSSSREVTVGPGYARVRGNLYHSDADVIHDIPVPAGGSQRIDYIALRYDPSQVTLDDRITQVLIQGQAAANPSAPSLTRDNNGVWEYPLIRIGPYGAGAISGAPSQFVGNRLEPVVVRNHSRPNDIIEGLPQVQGSTYIYTGSIRSEQGSIWVYDQDTGQYEKIGLPQTGSISAANGWTSEARWRLSTDGLVTLWGHIRRTGSTFTLGPNFGAQVLLTANLPSAIRPSTAFEGWLAAARYQTAPGSNVRRNGGVFVRFSGNSRLQMMAAEANEDMRFTSAGGDTFVSLSGISWWVD